MIIKIEDVINYIECPMKWFLRNKKPFLKTNFISLAEKYDEDIKKCIFYSYYKIQSEEKVRIEDIKLFWGKEWIKDRRLNSLMFSDTCINKDYYSIKRKNGLLSLIDFKNKFVDKRTEKPIAIDYKFNIKINDNITLSTNIELFTKKMNIMNEYTYENYIFKTNEHAFNSVTKVYELKAIANHIAIKQNFEKISKINSYIYNMDKRNISKFNITDEKIQLFYSTIETIANLMYNNIYYIAPVDKCDTCIYKEICGNEKLILEIIKE